MPKIRVQLAGGAKRDRGVHVPRRLAAGRESEPPKADPWMTGEDVMREFVKWLIVPGVLVAGLMFAAPQTASAQGVGIYMGPGYGYSPYSYRGGVRLRAYPPMVPGYTVRSYGFGVRPPVRVVPRYRGPAFRPYSRGYRAPSPFRPYRGYRW